VGLGPGQVADSLNFGNWIPPGSIHGMKWNDLNGDGVKDPGEPGLAGWQINLTGAATDSTTTDSLGNYWFMPLPPGTYTVSEVLQAGWVQTYPPPPGTHTVGLGPGQVADSLNFGNWRPPGSIHGMKWNDLNGDGVKDPGEPGLAGWQINLTGAATDSTTTDSLGNYWFMPLPPGTYTVSEVLQAGWVQTYPPPPGTHTVVLSPAQVADSIDFGNQSITPSVGSRDGLPQKFELSQNYPNPFNPSTVIRYGLPSRAAVKLSVYNMLGELVVTLVNGEQEAGYYEVVFENPGLASGVYLYRLQAGDFVETRKLVLLR